MSMFDIAYELDRCATEAKLGTEHESHDGWSFPHDRPAALYCGCGAVLVDASDPIGTT